MKEIEPFSEDWERKTFWQSVTEASYASYIAIGTLFGGVLVAPLLLYEIYGSDEEKNNRWSLIFVSVLLSFLIYATFFLYHFSRIYRQNHKNAFEKYHRLEILKIKHYGKSHAYLSAAFAIIHQMNRVEDLKFEMAIAKLSEFCTLIKEFFEVKNGATCACCIKILIKGESRQPGDFQVITLCRDSKSIVFREQASTQMNQSVRHTVKKNTCFLHFFENLNTHEARFFLSNDLTKEKPYNNSSFEYYRQSKEGEWPLPYKSEIVVPLIAKLPDENTPVLGFFCVDSEGVDGFNVEFDPEMLIGVADGLYNTLYNQVNKKYGIASRE